MKQFVLCHLNPHEIIVYLFAGKLCPREKKFRLKMKPQQHISKSKADASSSAPYYLGLLCGSARPQNSIWNPFCFWGTWNEVAMDIGFCRGN